MTDELRALLNPPEEARFRALLGLDGVPLRLVTSGWHRLVVLAPERVFTFPRHSRQVPMVEREAELLSSVDLGIAPRVLGLHRDEVVSPFPFLELTRIPGRSYDTIMADLAAEEAARSLEQLARSAARWHETPVPVQFRSRPDYREVPRVDSPWIRPGELRAAAAEAAEILAEYTNVGAANLWARALAPIAAMEPVTVHGELSEGQFLLDDDLKITGVVDWDALHVGHPLVDFDLGIGGHLMHRSDPEIKRRMWEAYTSGRRARMPDWPSIHLFWCLLDALLLVQHRPDDDRLPTVLEELAVVTKDLARACR